MTNYTQQPLRQAIAKRVETLTVKNPTMRDIEVSASPPPTQSCFDLDLLDLALKLKGINIERREGESGDLRLILRSGNRVLRGRGATTCM